MEKVLFLSIVGFAVVSGIIVVFSGSSQGTLVVSIDKELYNSGDIMQVGLLYNSVKNMENVRITVSGVKNRYGESLINVLDVKNFTLGENREEYTLRLPTCSSCSGVSPGEHTISVVLEESGVIIANKSKTFVLQ